MKWTSKPPTEPGWYWVREATPVWDFFNDPLCYRVCDGGYLAEDGVTKGGLHIIGPEASFDKPVIDFEGMEWAGPIPMPEEAE